MSNSLPYGVSQITLDASADMANYKRVKILTSGSPGKLALAAGNEDAIGVLFRSAKQDEGASVNLSSAPSGQYLAAAPISIGAKVYGDASGDVGTTNTNKYVGIAVSAAAAGERVDVLHVGFQD